MSRWSIGVRKRSKIWRQTTKGILCIFFWVLVTKTIISLEFVCKFAPLGTRHGHVSVRTHELVRFILDLTENPTKDIMRRSAKSYSTHCEDGMTPKTQYLGGLLVMQCWNSPQRIYLIVPTAQIDSPAGLESTYV